MGGRGPLSKLNILYVDDHEDVRDVVEYSLQLDAEIDVRVAGSGAQALEMLDENQFRPDVILLDVMMPHMDGLTVLAAIRTRAPFQKTPVIFITARTQSREISAFNALDIIGVITKPFDPLELAPEVREILRRSGE